MGHPPPDFEPLPDWYKVLELTKEASASAIRTSYKRLAFQYHPDKTLDEKMKPEMTRRFTQIQEAYEVLSDSRRKREYDEDLALEAKWNEEQRRMKERNERARRSQKAQTRYKEAEKRMKHEDELAEREYQEKKQQEEDLLRAAKQAQEARKQHAADQERRKTTSHDGDRSRRKEDEKRMKQEAKRMKEEEMHRREAELREQERIQREEGKKQHARDNEKRTRDRRQDRKDKDHAQFPIDDLFDTGSFGYDKSDGRGRSSKERLRDPHLNVPDYAKPRDRSPRQRKEDRDSSRNREHRDRDSDFSARGHDGDRRQRFYESNARRMSTEPLSEEYLRPKSDIYGSPSHSYSMPRAAAYSPPGSPRQRHSNPSMSSTHSYQTPNKGRDRVRDRVGGSSRKHSEAGLYSRDPYVSSIPEDINSSLPGNRDSGYSTSSAGTPLRPGDARRSSEKLDSKLYTDSATGKKYKAKVTYVSADEDDDDDTSTIGKARSKRATRQTSKESYSTPRHAPELNDDPFAYMMGGSGKSASFSHKDVNYGSKPTIIHTRSNSDHSSPPDITVESFGYPSHKSSRHVPPVGGVPSLARGATWST